MNDLDFSTLPKKERKRLKRELEKEEQQVKQKKTGLMKWIIIASLVGLLGVGGFFGYKELSKPLPGEKLPDLGRDHVERAEWSKFVYNSNPPTSGPHDVTWTKAGVYDAPQEDGYLIHSLEHGYIVISYNCGDMSAQECDKLKKELSDLANDKRLWKLIVVPRPTLDSRIAVTAWTVIDKMDTLDKGRITAFVDIYRNQGPEKTME